MTKLFFLGISLLFINVSLAKEPICKSSTGTLLSFKASTELYLGSESTQYIEIRDKLIPVYNELCKSNLNSMEIITKMHDKCNELVREKVKSDPQHKLHNSCEVAYRASLAFIEGIESSSKCEDKNAVSNLSRDAKDISNSIDTGYPGVGTNGGFETRGGAGLEMLQRGAVSK